MVNVSVLIVRDLSVTRITDLRKHLAKKRNVVFRSENMILENMSG